jgi:hypothetical protein
MEYAKILQQSAGKFDYRESPLKTLQKVNDLKKTINKDGRQSLPKREPYANKIATYLTKEHLDRKMNEGSIIYKMQQQKLIDDLQLKALANSQEQGTQEQYIKLAREQVQKMKLLSDPAQVAYLKKVDPLGYFYLEEQANLTQQKIDAIKQGKDPQNVEKVDNSALYNLLRGLPIQSSDTSSSADSFSLPSRHSSLMRAPMTQYQLTQNAIDALARYASTSSSSSAQPTEYESDYPQSEPSSLLDILPSSKRAKIMEDEGPILTQHMMDTMAQNPDVTPEEALNEALEDIPNARELLASQELAQAPAPAPVEAPVAAPVAAPAQQAPAQEPELTLNQLKILAKQKNIPVTKKGKAKTKTQLLQDIEDYDRQYALARQMTVYQEPIPLSIPSMSMLRKYGIQSLRKLADLNQIPYDETTSDKEIRELLILKKKGIRRVLSPQFVEPRRHLTQEEQQDINEALGQSFENQLLSQYLTEAQTATAEQAQAPAQAPAAAAEQAPEPARKTFIFKKSEIDKLTKQQLVVVAKNRGIDTMNKSKSELVSAILKFEEERKPKGSGFKSLASYPPHMIAGALHTVRQMKKNRLNKNEYNREQAHNLKNQAIRKVHGEGFFGDLKDKFANWFFWNVNPLGRTIGGLKEAHARHQQMRGGNIFSSFLSGIATPFRLARNINPAFDFGVGKAADALGVPTIGQVINQ